MEYRHDEALGMTPIGSPLGLVRSESIVNMKLRHENIRCMPMLLASAHLLASCCKLVDCRVPGFCCILD